MIIRPLFLACLIWISGIMCGCSAVNTIFKKDIKSSQSYSQVAPQPFVNFRFTSKEIEFDRLAKGESVKEIINFIIDTNMDLGRIAIDETKNLMNENNEVVQTVSRTFVPGSKNVKSTYYFEIKNRLTLCDNYYISTVLGMYNKVMLSVRSDIRPSYCNVSKQSK